jgi:putative proteasome-type protease
MTFCLGITVNEGLVGIADTRIISGSEMITARKVSTYRIPTGEFFLMTSGLRSLRDKSITYFEDQLETCDPEAFTKLHKIVNAYAAKIRQVSIEDKLALDTSGLHFNIHALIGGRLEADAGHQLYLIYPEGNWVQIPPGTPYHIIGERGYGKPVLDRTLKYDDTLRFALKVGCLAFDSTRISASDVDFPIDVVLYLNESHELVEHRYEQADLREISTWWQERLRESVSELPSEWIDNVASKLKKVEGKGHSQLE